MKGGGRRHCLCCRFWCSRWCQRPRSSVSTSCLVPAHACPPALLPSRLQYPGLQSQVAADLATMLVLSDAAHRLFPATSWRWLFEELQR